MKGTLDADVARIKNPESAKNEKTEKEKLGAGDTSCKKSSDPVNLSTGNFIYDHEDMQAGGEIPLSFHRYYNSKDTGTGTMGSCFLHNYEMEVQKQPDQKAAVRMHDGQFYYFAETDTGYVAENAAMGLLERTEDGYKLTCHPGMDAVYFDKNGKAARQENTNKRGITFIRDERGRLEKAETDTGSFLEYAYDSEGMLMEVTDHAGRKVKLEYDGGMLKTVTTPSGAVYTYSYGDNGRITETVNARNVTAVRNRYDSLFRVTHQEFPDGGTMDFEYDDKNSREYVRQEKAGADKMELEKFTLGSLRRAVFEGDTATGSLMAGQVAGMLHEVRPVADILADLYESGRQRIAALNAEC